MPGAVGVIQARMGSSRLPGKVLLPLAGAPMLQRLIERVTRARSLDAVVVATSVEPSDDAIMQLCQVLGVTCHRGSETDVFTRVLDAAARCTSDIVVRMTGDNPFLPPELIDEAVGEVRAGNADYCAALPESGYPAGLTVEAMRYDALAACAASDDPMVREHVTWSLRHDESIRRRTLRPGLSLGQAEFTIDTPADFARLAPIFERLYAKNPAFGLDALDLMARGQID